MLAISGHFLPFVGAFWAQIFVEEVLSFEMSTQTSKSDKN